MAPEEATGLALATRSNRDARDRSDPSSLQMVGFRLDQEEYGIEITKIQEIILMGEITRIPQVPHYIEGLINLRGSVIPIFHLRKRFGLPATPYDDETRIVVVNVGDKTIGVIVDAVTQVIRIAHSQVDPAPATVSSLGKEFISGLAKLTDRLLILLDIDHLLQAPALTEAKTEGKTAS